MAKMTVENVRVALAGDGTLTLPDAEQLVVGRVLRDGKKWAAAVADEHGKIGAKTSAHPTRKAAFEHVLQARGVVTSPEAA